jgi:hypothetical protein
VRHNLIAPYQKCVPIPHENSVAPETLFFHFIEFPASTLIDISLSWGVGRVVHYPIWRFVGAQVPEAGKIASPAMGLAFCGGGNVILIGK